MMNRVLSTRIDLQAGKMTTVFMQRLVLASACAMVAQISVAAERVGLTQVMPIELPNGETELRMVFSGAPPVPQAYQIERPARLVVDLPATSNELNTRYQNLTTGQARSMSIVDNQEITRLVINLSETGGYTTRVEGNTLILRIGQAALGAATTVSSPNRIAAAQAVVAAPKMVSQAESAIANIDFRRGTGGDGQVLVRLNNPNVPVDVQQQGSKITARFLGTKLPENLRRRLNVNDFATPVSLVDAYNEGSNAVIVIQPQGDFEYLAYQADNQLTISVKRPAQDAVKRAEPPTFVGERLSMDFQDIEVRSVLQLIADFTKQNLVASDTVQGRITIRLQSVPWDQALDIILRTKGLDQRKSGNVIMIAPAAEIAAREKLEIQASQQILQLAPLQTEYIQLSYAKAMDVQTLITSGRNNGGSGNTGASNNSGGEANVGSLLSSRGTMSVDARTNTLIIQDTARKIDEIRELILKLDVPIRQVMIEARIVRATDSFSKELGVKWGVLSNPASHAGIGGGNLQLGGSEQTLADLRDVDDDGKVTITRPQNLNIDMGVKGAGASRIALGILNMSDVILDLELSALQADGKGEIVATPKVLTTDKQKARVAAGTQIPYQTATSSGATAIQFINAELSLEVTPSITPDGRIGMELFVNSDSPGEIQPTGIRAIDTNRVSTNVLVDDGQTVVLGGIFQNQTTKGTLKTPFLGDLPYVGRLFRKETQSNNKQELLIFVTPRLVSETNTGR
ncbi:MAG: type IV pilus secretin PilQ [Flavobacteriales bacterium]